MLPALVFMYVRLARREEREALAQFGDAYRAYMRDVPAFVPRRSLTQFSGHKPRPSARAGGE